MNTNKEKRVVKEKNKMQKKKLPDAPLEALWVFSLF
jgi:hypothetical protein